MAGRVHLRRVAGSMAIPILVSGSAVRLVGRVEMAAGVCAAATQGAVLVHVKTVLR